MSFPPRVTGKLRGAETRLPGERVLRRIAGLTLGFGLAAAAVAVAMRRPDWAKGLVGGALLGWLNFRWLSRGIRAMMLRASWQASGAPNSSESAVTAAKSMGSPLGTYFVLLFRYALVAAGVYVIFVYLHVPLISIGLGLCALVAAIMAASVWEVLRPES
jgi:hypothetical protein